MPPFAGVENSSQVLDGIPDVLEAEVERRDAETQDVRLRCAVAGAEVADDTACDQRLCDGGRQLYP